MSYSFDGANDTMTGTFTSTYNGHPVTMGCFLKVTTHPVATDRFVSFGNNSGSQNDSHTLQSSTVDDRWWATSQDTTGADAVVSSVNIDGVWAGYVGRFTNATLRDLYVQAFGNTGQNTTSKAVANAMQFIRLGEGFGGSQDYTGKLAEVAIWNSALSDGDITLYLGGQAASTIAAASLIGYWDLATNNATQANAGLDAGGDLTVTGATFDSDHPVIVQAGQPAQNRFRGIPGMNTIASRFGRGW